MTARGVSSIHSNDIHNEYHLSVYLVHHEVRSCCIWLVLIGSHKMKDASTAVAMQLFWYPSNIYCVMTAAVVSPSNYHYITITSRNLRRSKKVSKAFFNQKESFCVHKKGRNE